MKKILLVMITAMMLSACNNEASLNPEDFESLSEEMQTNIEENTSHRGVYLFEFSERTPLVVAQVKEGTDISLTQESEEVVGVEINTSEEGEAEEMQVYRLELPNDIHEVKLYVDGMETHFDGVQR